MTDLPTRSDAQLVASRHWKAVCVERRTHRLGRGGWKRASNDTSPAAYFTLRGPGRSNARGLPGDFVTFYEFPQEHWVHVRTSNPIESIFAGVRLRTRATKRMRVRENALYLVFKLVTRLSLNWRGINAPNQLKLLLAGHPFQDGQLLLEDTRVADLVQVAAA